MPARLRAWNRCTTWDSSARLIPEWEPVVGRVQHDLYHVYTVDQHSLYAVATLKAIARGEMAAEYPQVSPSSPRSRGGWPCS